MYFINIKELKKDIVEKKFSEKDRFIYIMLYIGLSAILFELLISFPDDTILTIYDYTASTISVLILLIGSYFIYKENGANNGEDFAGKYFSIIWVVSWRVVLAIIPLIILFLIFISYQELALVYEEVFLLILLTGMEFLIYYLSYKHTLDIQNKN